MRNDNPGQEKLPPSMQAFNSAMSPSTWSPRVRENYTTCTECGRLITAREGPVCAECAEKKNSTPSPEPVFLENLPENGGSTTVMEDPQNPQDLPPQQES